MVVVVFVEAGAAEAVVPPAPGPVPIPLLVLVLVVVVRAWRRARSRSTSTRRPLLDLGDVKVTFSFATNARRSVGSEISSAPRVGGVGLGRAARIRGRVLMGREGRDGAAATGVRELSPDHFES